MINIIFFYLNKFKTFPSAEEQLNKKKTKHKTSTKTHHCGFCFNFNLRSNKHSIMYQTYSWLIVVNVYGVISQQDDSTVGSIVDSKTLPLTPSLSLSLSFVLFLFEVTFTTFATSYTTTPSELSVFYI